MRDRKMHLLAYVKTGPTAQLAGAWRHPEADLDDIFCPERYERFGSDIKLTRTQTIMQGASHCDFRYRRQKD